MELRRGEWQLLDVLLEEPTERVFAGDNPYVSCKFQVREVAELPPKSFGEIDGREIFNDVEWDRAYAASLAPEKGWEVL